MNNLLYKLSLVLGLFVQHIHAQDLLFIQEGVLNVAGETSLHVEGGILIEGDGRLRNEGRVYLGSSGSGYRPQEADWTQNDLGTLLGNSGIIEFAGEDITHRIQGDTEIIFPVLYITNNALMQTSIKVKELLIRDAVLDLNSQRLMVDNPLSTSLLQLGQTGGIVSETHPDRNKDYGQVSWNLAGANADSLYTIPLSTQNAIPIPVSFRLGSRGTDTLNVATYPTNPDNTPYPSQVGFLQDVAHMRGPNGEDISSDFLDRFWLVNGEENEITYLSLAFDPENEVSGNVSGHEARLRVQEWTSAKWTFFDWGDQITSNTIAWSDSRIFPNIYSASISANVLPVSNSHGLQAYIQQLDLYPNPSKGKVQVSVTYQHPQSVQLRLLDQQGKILLKQKRPPHAIRDRFEMDLTSYPAGIYWLQLSSDDNVMVRRLIKY